MNARPDFGWNNALILVFGNPNSREMGIAALSAEVVSSQSVA